MFQVIQTIHSKRMALDNFKWVLMDCHEKMDDKLNAPRLTISKDKLYIADVDELVEVTSLLLRLQINIKLRFDV